MREGCAVFILGIFSIMVTALVSGWVIMVLWGMVAGHFGWQTLSYPIAVAVAWLLAIVGSRFKS